MHTRHLVLTWVVAGLLVLSGLGWAAQSPNPNGPAAPAAPVTVSGKVADAQGKPIEGAKVTLYQMVYAEGASTANAVAVDEKTSDAEGAFTLTIPSNADPKRMAYVVARKGGLALGWTYWRMQSKQETAITLGPAQDLAGEVVDEKGQPVAEAQVRIAALMVGKSRDRRSLPTPSFLCVKSDGNGRFLFTDMPAEATFEFTVEKPGRATISTLDRTTYRGGLYQFSAGQAGIKLTLPLEARIEGTVVEKATGKPVGGVAVTALPDTRLSMLLSPKTATTAADGTFRIGTLTAGPYVVQLPRSRESIGPGGVPMPEQVAEWVAEPLRVTVKAGESKSDLKLELTKGGIIEVLVKDAAGKPVDRASVNVFCLQTMQMGGQSVSGRTDGKGLARIRVTPGQYLLGGVFKEGYSRRMSVVLRPEEAFTVEEGETKRVDHVLSAGPKATGVVRDEAGNPLASVKFEILPMMAMPNEVTSDASGKFEVSWDPSMRGPQGGTCVLVARDVARNLAEAVDLEEQGGALDLKLKPGIVVTGTVLSQDGQPLPDARVRVAMQLSRGSGTMGRGDLAKVGPDGKFEIKAIPPDRQYTVSATAEGYGRGDVPIDAADLKDNRVDAGQFKLVPANLSVTGTVVDPNDQPVVGASIYGFGEGQPDGREAQTDSEGKFTLKGVCPGPIRLQVNARGSMPMFSMAQAEGGATDLHIVISQRPTLSTYMPRKPTALKGKPLPPLKDLGIDLPAEADGKMLLVCFWDLGQRPSRNCLTQLAAQATALGQKAMVVVAVQAAKVEGGALSQWVEKTKIPFKVGSIPGDSEKTQFAWGVASLPHLILTDKKHTVVAEGFGLADLDKQIESAGQ